MTTNAIRLGSVVLALLVTAESAISGFAETGGMLVVALLIVVLAWIAARHFETVQL